MKNRFMKLAALLLVLTLVTSCFVGGTFAKYSSGSTGTDTATVAYWGFNQTGTFEFNIFDHADTGVANGLLAPGSSHTVDFSFDYAAPSGEGAPAAPQVAYELGVSFDTTGTTTNLDANQNFVWKLGKQGGTLAEYQTLAELKAAVLKLSGDTTGTTGKKQYAAGSLPGEFGDGVTYTIGWEWKFEGSTEYGDSTPKQSQDQFDTAMGNASALENVSITISIGATQLDTYTAPTPAP